jgi:hypothetical protein
MGIAQLAKRSFPGASLGCAAGRGAEREPKLVGSSQLDECRSECAGVVRVDQHARHAGLDEPREPPAATATVARPAAPASSRTWPNVSVVLGKQKMSALA